MSSYVNLGFLSGSHCFAVVFSLCPVPIGVDKGEKWQLQPLICGVLLSNCYMKSLGEVFYWFMVIMLMIPNYMLYIKADLVIVSKS